MNSKTWLISWMWMKIQLMKCSLELPRSKFIYQYWMVTFFKEWPSCIVFPKFLQFLPCSTCNCQHDQFLIETIQTKIYIVMCIGMSWNKYSCMFRKIFFFSKNKFCCIIFSGFFLDNVVLIDATNMIFCHFCQLLKLSLSSVSGCLQMK